jgi:hypothetical protein
LALGLVGFAYVGFDRLSADKVRFGLLSYEVVDDATTEVRFQVDKAAGETVTCFVRAQDAQMRTVGSQDVVVGPDASGRTTQTVRLTTTSRAASGQVVGCGRTP